AARRDDRRDGFALPAGAIDRDSMLRRRLETLQMREHADPGRDDGRKLFARYDSDDARRTSRLSGRDAHYSCVRMGRAQEYHMPHPRQFHVADVKPASLHQPFKVRSWNQLADIRVRAIKLREDVGLCGCGCHGLRPLRLRAVVSIASTMAW